MVDTKRGSRNFHFTGDNEGATCESGFVDGKYAFSWNGNWAPLNAFDDTVFLPAPDFGAGPRIGAASWQFGVSAVSRHPDVASAFIAFAFQDKDLAAFSDAMGLIPRRNPQPR